MFTGIIECVGKIQKIVKSGGNKSFYIQSPITDELKTDQSVSHNGVCLTIESVQNGLHRITAIQETLLKTNLETWKEGDEINLERCLQMNGRLDGHLVQGHVDATAQCIRKNTLEGSWEFTFKFPRAFSHLVIEKGSVCLNGVSLTAFNVKQTEFTVAIIPYTYNHTNFKHLSAGQFVNTEFDLIGKYLARYKQVFGNAI